MTAPVSPFGGFLHGVNCARKQKPSNFGQTKLASDTNIWRSANELMQQYGRQADFQAALRAARHLIKDDMEAHDTWMEVVRAIIQLQASDPSETRH